jgi:hypothetical protein
MLRRSKSNGDRRAGVVCGLMALALGAQEESSRSGLILYDE